MKPVKWLGTSKKDVKAFDPDVRRMAGFELGLVQQGLDPTDWKPMPTVALDVREIRIHTRVESRVLYVAKFADAIYVLHAFVKKTEKTDPRDINIAKSRMAALIEERRMEGDAK